MCALGTCVDRNVGSTIARGIHSIPLFVFNLPSTGAVGGPFREGQGSKEPYTVNGSSSAEAFLQLFEQIVGTLRVLRCVCYNGQWYEQIVWL